MLHVFLDQCVKVQQKVLVMFEPPFPEFDLEFSEDGVDDYQEVYEMDLECQDKLPPFPNFDVEFSLDELQLDTPSPVPRNYEKVPLISRQPKVDMTKRKRFRKFRKWLGKCKKCCLYCGCIPKDA